MSVVIIETGRPLENARGGGSINSMLVLARYYSNLGIDVHIIFRHYTAIDADQLPEGVNIDYLNGPRPKKINIPYGKPKNKIFLTADLKAFIATFLRLKETFRIFHLLKPKRNLIAVHLNNRLLPNTHLIWLKILLGVRLYQHQRQYDTYLPYPKWIYNIFIDRVICVSKDIRNHTESLGITKTEVLYNSSLRHQGESTYDTHIDTYNFIWIGRIVAWKGLHELAVVLEGMNCKLQIFGSADETSAYARETFKLLNEKGVHYEYHGYVPSTQIFSRHYRNTFLIHSSVKPEPFGRVIIEAMSIGMIPVSFGLGGSRELINHEVNGLIIAPQTPLRTYLDTCSLHIPKMGIKAKDKFDSTYSSDVHFTNLKEILCVE